MGASLDSALSRRRRRCRFVWPSWAAGSWRDAWASSAWCSLWRVSRPAGLQCFDRRQPGRGGHSRRTAGGDHFAGPGRSRCPPPAVVRRLPAGTKVPRHLFRQTHADATDDGHPPGRGLRCAGDGRGPASGSSSRADAVTRWRIGPVRRLRIGVVAATPGCSGRRPRARRRRRAPVGGVRRSDGGRAGAGGWRRVFRPKTAAASCEAPLTCTGSG